MIEMEIRIGGFKELDNAFKTLPNAMSKTVLRSAIKKALKPVLNDARSDVPVDRGDLKESLTINTKLGGGQKSEARSGAVTVYMGTSVKQGAVGHLVEFGTSKMRMNPFVRPSWDANKRGVVKTIGNEAWRKLQLLARRLFRQAKAGKLSKTGRRALL